MSAPAGKGPRDLLLWIFARRRLDDLEVGRGLLELLEREAPEWKPGRWDVAEPVRRRWDEDALQTAWRERSLTLLSESPGAAEIEIERPAHGDPHASIRFLARSSSIDQEHALRLLTGLSDLVDADLGLLQSTVHRDRDDLFGFWQDDAGNAWMALADWHLYFFLPGLAWATVFGPSYVALLGEERIANAPAHVVEKLGDARYLLQLTGSMEDNRTRRESVTAAREAVLEHLGRDAFWHSRLENPVMPRQGPPRPAGRAPTFDDLRNTVWR